MCKDRLAPADNLKWFAKKNEQVGTHTIRGTSGHTSCSFLGCCLVLWVCFTTPVVFASVLVMSVKIFSSYLRCCTFCNFFTLLHDLWLLLCRAVEQFYFSFDIVLFVFCGLGDSWERFTVSVYKRWEHMARGTRGVLWPVSSDAFVFLAIAAVAHFSAFSSLHI